MTIEDDSGEHNLLLSLCSLRSNSAESSRAAQIREPNVGAQQAAPAVRRGEWRESAAYETVCDSSRPIWLRPLAALCLCVSVVDSPLMPQSLFDEPGDVVGGVGDRDAGRVQRLDLRLRRSALAAD